MSGHQDEPSQPGVAPGAGLAVALALSMALMGGVACTRPDRRPRLEPSPPPGTLPASAGAGGSMRMPGDSTVCANAGCIAPGPIPADATCFELRNHAANDRQAPFVVQPFEAVTCFHYDVPWVEPSGLIAWQTRGDAPAMREWQLFTSAGANDDGSVESCIAGGDSRDALLLMAHPTGGNDVLMPDGVGLRLPAPGTRVVLQWHSLNEGGAAVPDSSSVLLCTRPTARLQRIAGLTVLGTENIGGREGLGLGQQSVNAACTLEGETPVQLLMLAPHMNALGRHVRMTVQRASGAAQPFYDVDFRYDRQLMRATDVTLRPGDRVTTRCTYDNDTGMRVRFHPSSFQSEQCYVYVISEPAGLLDTASPSVLSMTNTCWAF